MWRLTLAQMRRSLGRLTAAGIAVAIGTAFVAATLLAGDVMQRISYDSITASYGTADLIAVSSGTLTDADVAAVRGLQGVSAADPRVVVPSVELSSGDKVITQALVPVPGDEAFDTQHVTQGALPTGDGEITLPERAAERLGVAAGDEVTVGSYVWEAADAAGDGTTSDDETAADDAGTVRKQTEQVTVVGLTSDPTSAWAQYGGVAMSTTADALRWSGAANGPGVPTITDLGVDQVLLALDPGADTEAVRASVREVLETSSSDALVLTRDEAAERSISGDSTGPVVVVVLAFAAVAMIVAGLVIANTFQVLVAQRTRTLALLRCVGAVRSQVRRSVLLEATLLGLVASVAGTLLGTLLVQVALWVMQGADLPFPVPAAVHVTPAAVLAPLAVGVLVTVLAALTPARVATRVAPIAALRPADAPAAGSRAGRVRLVLSLLLVVGGVALLAGGLALSRVNVAAAVGVAILGGLLSFVGLLVGAVFWMPRVVAATGRLAGRAGMPARLAAANTGRNPARTAATSTALLIGVTLVAMMSTGAATARATLDGELDTRFPVDLQVSAPTTVDSEGRTVDEPLPAGTADQIAGVEGVEAVTVVRRDDVVVGGDNPSLAGALALGTEQASAVMRSADVAAALSDGTVVVGRSLAGAVGVSDGDAVPVTLADDSTGETAADATPVTLTARVVDYDDWSVIVTPATLERIGSPGSPGTAWVRVTDVNDSGAVVQDIEDLTEDSALDISGAAVERALYQRAIDTVLAVVVGLLAVAVVIALIGVTNTLSLSVIERRRESATLRALGLTRRQLRASMAVEGALIAGVGAVVGVLLGLAYGWLGSTAVLADFADLELRVPWSDLGLVLGIAVVAGVLASVLPSRNAARTPPVAALGVD
ncbi:ABC transporter permease [Cellulomonas sp. C5510]|uniref:ABC transporter permease n=1 Tax=Cellulomonas sp. C5510 TaxID=2871170 RepID=UPI001C970B93|nr:ABC transporter permease [Cellulomonas sp. C5510]QZN87606.1 ABC transporter permease [Cellulomonas sp. C5510]